MWPVPGAGLPNGAPTPLCPPCPRVKPVVILSQRDLLEVEVQAVASGRLQQPVARQVVAVVPGEAGRYDASHRGVPDHPAARRCGRGAISGQPCLTLPCPPVPALTEAEGLAGAPEGTGGVAADKPTGALQLVASGAAEPGVPAGVQAADRHLPKRRPCREGAAQQVGWGQVAAVSFGADRPLGDPSPPLTQPPRSAWVLQGWVTRCLRLPVMMLNEPVIAHTD